MEQLPWGIRPLLRQLGLAPPVSIESRNVGLREEYAGLYNAFKQRFRPTSCMLNYYYGARFWSHFYAGKGVAFVPA